MFVMKPSVPAPLYTIIPCVQTMHTHNKPPDLRRRCCP